MPDKKGRGPTTDGRTDRQIRTIAMSDQVSKLTDKQYDRYVKVIYPETYGKPYGKRAGGMVKGFSPIARPQRFRGIF